MKRNHTRSKNKDNATIEFEKNLYRETKDRDIHGYPRDIWETHVYGHLCNYAQVHPKLAKKMAKELGINIDWSGDEPRLINSKEQ